MRIYAYLRASTKEQNASRAEKALAEFAKENGHSISHPYIENESGAVLQRPKLFELMNVANEGDVILIEQVDRLSRLNEKDWQKLRATIKSKGLHIVSLDLPTSHGIMKEGSAADGVTGQMMRAVNEMMLDMLAIVSRKDYEDRRRRQAEGIEIAKQAGKYKGRPDDTEKQDRIKTLLQAKVSYSEIQKTLNCSRGIIAKVSKMMKEAEAI